MCVCVCVCVCVVQRGVGLAVWISIFEGEAKHDIRRIGYGTWMIRWHEELRSTKSNEPHSLHSGLIRGSHDKGVAEGRPSQRGSAQRMFISRKQKSLNQLITELELLSIDRPLLGFYSHHSFLPAWSLLPSFLQSLCSFHLSTLSWAFPFTLLPGLG